MTKSDEGIKKAKERFKKELERIAKEEGKTLQEVIDEVIRTKDESIWR